MEDNHFNTITIDAIKNESALCKGIKLDILRLDKIHPVVSGNKWFKLKYYILEAKERGYTSLLTFGGAYSNHIAAAAYASRENGFRSIGIIRGEEPKEWSHTLKEAEATGMQLHFLSRALYDKYKRISDLTWVSKQFGDCYIVPEGGIGKPGIKGATEILQGKDVSRYTHIIAAVGTGTTIGGILKSTDHQQIVGISSMKNNTALAGEIEAITGNGLPERFHLVHDYHFGGYAKYNAELLYWMNNFYHGLKIPLDFVYTGKMMFGIFDMIESGYFPQKSNILAVHSGGLQGNRSLAPGLLDF